MVRALQILVCLVAIVGCSRVRENPLEPVEEEQVPPALQGDRPAPVDEGVAGMSGEADALPDPSVDVEPEPLPEDDAVCASLAQLAARDGAITFNEDGSATITVALQNVSDEDMFDYPGINVWWEVPQRYAGGDAGDLLLYGLLAQERWEHAIQVPADMFRPQGTAGQPMIVHATPFTLSSRYGEAACEEVSLEFSAVIP